VTSVPSWFAIGATETAESASSSTARSSAVPTFFRLRYSHQSSFVENHFHFET
jgi:hypothetical protein